MPQECGYGAFLANKSTGHLLGPSGKEIEGMMFD